MEEVQLLNYHLNDLNDNHPKSDNIPGLNLNLMSHQKTAIHHCEILERNEGFKIKWDEENLYVYSRYKNDDDIKPFRDVYTNIGIIGCKVGSGKSFVALGLILKNYLLNFNRSICSEKSNLLSSFKRIETNDFTVSTNIILVPHNLVSQWNSYIQNHTNAIHYVISCKKDYDKISAKLREYKTLIDNKDEPIKIEKSLKELTERKIYLISSKMWNEFCFLWNSNINKKVSRLFVDEVHAINIPNSKSIKNNFIWLITSSLHDIGSHRNIGFIKDTIDTYFCIYHQYRNFITIKNNDNYVDSSLKLPIPIETIIKSKSNVLLDIFKNVINDDVKNMLLAEDIQGVINYLGITAVNEGDIIKVICSNLDNELNNARVLLEAKEKMTYPTEQIKNEALSKTKDKIKSIETKIDNVRQRISESNIDPIMHIDIVNPVITACCNNKFDLECITSYFEYEQKKGRNPVLCPMCRGVLNINKLVFMGAFQQIKIKEVLSDIEYKYEEHTKMENLEYLLRNKISLDKKILIFSEHEGNHHQISEIFEKVGRKNLSALKGGISHIDNLIQKFNSGETPHLFLNAKYCGSGLNLEKTDNVIIMHRMSPDNIKQVIGRANRLNRVGALQVFFMYTDSEY